MKKRALILLVVLIGVLAGAWFEPTATVRGKLRGEEFYEGRSATYWSEKLQSQDPTDQAEVPKKLREGGAAAVPLLIQLTRSPVPAVRWQAAAHLAKVKDIPAPAIDALLALLDDPDSYVRHTAAQALGELHPDRPDVVAALIGKLSTPDRDAVVRPLSAYRASAVEAVPKLIEILQAEQNDMGVRWNAARTLGKIGPAAKSAIPTLIAVLKDSEVLLREHAAEALGDIGPDSAEAVPHLIPLLKDEDSRVRRDVVRALGMIGPAAKSASPAILPLLNDDEPPVREAAKVALRKLE